MRLWAGGVLPHWRHEWTSALPARWLSGLCSSVCTDAIAVIAVDFITGLGVWSSHVVPPTPPHQLSLGYIFFLFFFFFQAHLDWFYPFALSCIFKLPCQKFKFLKDRSFCFTEKEEGKVTFSFPGRKNLLIQVLFPCDLEIFNVLVTAYNALVFWQYFQSFPTPAPAIFNKNKTKKPPSLCLNPSIHQRIWYYVALTALRLRCTEY